MYYFRPPSELPGLSVPRFWFDILLLSWKEWLVGMVQPASEREIIIYLAPTLVTTCVAVMVCISYVERLAAKKGISFHVNSWKLRNQSCDNEITISH